MIRQLLEEAAKAQADRVKRFSLQVADVGAMTKEQLGEEARRLFYLANGFTRDPRRLGSWISGHRLPFLLLQKGALTVDLLPDFMPTDEFCQQRFGVKYSALKALAASGRIYFNVRDYDPRSRAVPTETLAETYAAAEDLLTHTLESQPQNVYFTATLRDAIFDPLSAASQGRSFRELIGDWSDVADKYLDYYQKPQVERAHFRGEVTHPNAFGVHWAHYKALESCIREQDPRLHHRIQAAEQTLRRQCYGDGWVGEDHQRRFHAAAAELTDLLRFSHLAWSAPVTACYGHSYFLTPSEFERLVTVTHQIDNHYDVEDFGLIEVLAAVMNGRIAYSDEFSARARIKRLFLGGALGIHFDRSVPSALEQALATPAGVERFLSELDDLGPAFAMEAAAATLARTVGADLRRQLDVLGDGRSSLEDALEAVSHANHRKCEALNTTCCKLLQAGAIAGAVAAAIPSAIHPHEQTLIAYGTSALPILLIIATTSTNLKAHVATAIKTTVEDSDRVIVGKLGAFAHRLRSRH